MLRHTLGGGRLPLRGQAPTIVLVTGVRNQPSMEFQVDEDVKKMIAEQDCDFRICTACYGPALVTTAVKPPKESDIQIPVGNHTIFVSRYQAPYVRRITMDMVYSEDEIDSCPAFYVRRRYRAWPRRPMPWRGRRCRPPRSSPPP